jgi:hypothetical protein
VTAAEDVWRQIAEAAVVTMEEASFLVTAQRAIDGIQIQDDLSPLAIDLSPRLGVKL